MEYILARDCCEASRHVSLRCLLRLFEFGGYDGAEVRNVRRQASHQRMVRKKKVSERTARRFSDHEMYNYFLAIRTL